MQQGRGPAEAIQEGDGCDAVFCSHKVLGIAEPWGTGQQITFSFYSLQYAETINDCLARVPRFCALPYEWPLCPIESTTTDR